MGEQNFVFCVNVSSQLQNAGADLFEIAVPETADFVSGRKKFKTAAKCAGRKALRKKLDSGSETRKEGIGGRELAHGDSQAESFQQNLQNKPVSCGEPLFQTFPNIHVN